MKQHIRNEIPECMVLIITKGSFLKSSEVKHMIKINREKIDANNSNMHIIMMLILYLELG